MPVLINRGFPRWLLLLPAAAVPLALADWRLSAATLALFALSIAFFRDPERVPEGAGVVSPADGVVRAVSEVDGGTRVSIFMRLRDVHVNRVPYGGAVEDVEYLPGRFVPAFLEASRSERNVLTVSTRLGPFVVEQVAGVFARRIRCFVGEGDRVYRGQRFGLIAFSSRVNMVLPLPSRRLRVSEGDTVKAGETLLVGLEVEEPE